MRIGAGLLARAKVFVLSTFTELSAWKRALVRAAVVALVIGLALHLKAWTSGEPSEWARTMTRWGAGFLLGFMAGAFVRMFTVAGLLLVVVVAAGAWVLTQLGWIESPYRSLGDAQDAFTRTLKDSASSLDAFFHSQLPKSFATVVGLFAGFTQRPRYDAPARTASPGRGEQ
jgi:uncharacterized membrane protein (Fun14 family)